MTRVRLRLTVFYALLLGAAAGLLLLVSYVLVRNHLDDTLDTATAHAATATLGSQYALAFVAVVLLAAGGGWLVSGEVLAPLERAAALQRRFIANASHELRTPMTALRVDAEVALYDPDASVEELRAVLANTIATTEETDRLMTALLTLTSATDGRRADEPVDLAAAVREALPRSARLDVQLDGSRVRGDDGLLRRAVANLVDNALRHGAPGGRVDVRLRDGELTVSNGGTPIAPEDLKRLAEPFERLRRGTTSGTGLGLAIVRGIAESHGGTLRLEAPASGGLVARLRLPST